MFVNFMRCEELKEVLTFNLYQFLNFSRVCTKIDVIFGSVARNSRDLTSLELSPAPHTCIFRSRINKTIFYRNIRVKQKTSVLLIYLLFYFLNIIFLFKRPWSFICTKLFRFSHECCYTCMCKICFELAWWFWNLTKFKHTDGQKC